MDDKRLELAMEVGKASQEAIVAASRLVKPGARLLDVAEAAEKQLKASGFGLAFPLNLSQNERAAHYSPSLEDKTVFSEKDIVSITSWPRTRPSVVSMAMARTAFSPRCWATSNTRRNFLPVRASVLVVSSAFRIAGSSPSNSTSTTAPMIWIRRPLDSGLVMASSLSF